MTRKFESIAADHLARYPRMKPQDLCKLAYQSEFGPAHMIADEQAALNFLRSEWEEAEPCAVKTPEDIGGGLCRFYLGAGEDKKTASEILVKLFCSTSKTVSGTVAGLEEKLKVLEKLPVEGMAEYLKEYRAQGCPAQRHSAEYRAAYDPHYRVLKWEYARLFPVLMEIAGLKRPAVIAIDGRCGSGKSTVADLIAQVFHARVFHMDDFYLPVSLRAKNWLDIPGGNMDLERVRREVLDPAFAGEAVCYRPFDCGTGTIRSDAVIPAAELTVVEGSYSHHPALEADYDLKLFVTCADEERFERLKEREGDYFPAFQTRWIPLEERYISAFGIGMDCITIDTEDKPETE